MEKNNSRFSRIRVALDGPSGAGKSTVAKAVARKTGLVYVDTGALYRTVGLFAAQNGIAHDDSVGIVECLDKIDIKLAYENGSQKVYLCGEEVGDKIRTENASLYASAVSKVPEVRAFLLEMQKKLAHEGGVIMDGRDIGTVIIPDAELKIFMTATPEERARRRFLEQKEKGLDVTYDDILESIVQRDKQDSERETAPLKPADDAIIFTNDGYNVDECADYIVQLMEEIIEEKTE